MRFLILDNYYREALRSVYSRSPGLETCSYEEQLAAVYDLGFARADFLVRNLRALGQEAEQVIANAVPLQRQLAVEHGLRLPRLAAQSWLLGARRLGRRAQWVAGLTPLPSLTRSEMRIVVAQIEALDPDVVLNCDVLQLPSDLLRGSRQRKRILIGECSSPIPSNLDLSGYDLLLSAGVHYVERFRKAGTRTELLRLAFEPAILLRLGDAPQPDGVVFIGSVGRSHQRRAQVLEAVGAEVPLRCYGQAGRPLASRLRFRPPLWGYEMYREFQRARVTLNVHIDIAERIAGNMRLFEATGVGTLLVTDWKDNLKDLFEVGTEVVAFQSPEECVEIVRYYLAHESERCAIARAGQQRTLREHTYFHRMQELMDIVTRLSRS